MLESGAYSLVLTDNYAFISLKNIFEKLDIRPGKYFLEEVYSRNCLSIENIDRKTLKVAKNGRQNCQLLGKFFLIKIGRMKEEMHILHDRFRLLLLFCFCFFLGRGWGVVCVLFCSNFQHSTKIFSESSKDFKLKFLGNFMIIKTSL